MKTTNLKKSFFPILLLVSVILFFNTVGAAEAQIEDQHHLRIGSEPRDLMFIPGQGFYDNGDVVTLTEMPETWRDYTFVGWRIDGAWAAENPPKIRMDRPHEAVAVFEKTEENATKDQSILIDSIPRVSSITVDDEVYLPNELPVTLDWDGGTTHVIIVENIVKDSADKRYVFDMWKDSEQGNVRTVESGEVDSLIAIFDTQYYLRAITEYGSIEGGGWYDEDDTANFKVVSEFASHNDESIRYAFDSWDGGDYTNSIENSIPIQGPTTVKAKWNEEYYLDIRSNVPDYVPPGSGFYPKGKSLALISENDIRSSTSDVSYVFEKWTSIGPNPVIISNTVSPSTSITIDNPYIIEARFTESYRINAWTPYGSVSGSGFYENGEIAEIKINSNEIVSKPGKIKKIFSGWDTNGAKIMDFSSEGNRSLEQSAKPNLMIIVDQPGNVTAQWKEQYYLDIRSSEGEVKGSGWYNPGAIVPISVSAPSQPPGMWSSYSFVGWSGDLESAAPNGKVIMSGPKSVVAEWEVDNSPGIINGIILGGLGIAGYFVYTKTKNRGGGLDHIITTKKKDFSFDRRNLDLFIGGKKQPKFGGSTNTQTLPTKKTSIIDWLMGNDKK